MDKDKARYEDDKSDQVEDDESIPLADDDPSAIIDDESSRYENICINKLLLNHLTIFKLTKITFF